MSTTYTRRVIFKAAVAGAAAAGLVAGTPAVSSARPGRPGDSPEIPDVPGMQGDPRANEFWYQYDLRFLFEPSAEVRQAFQAISAALGPVEGGFYGAWAGSRAAGTYPQGYIDLVGPTRDPLAVISRHQRALVDEFYHADRLGLINAVTDFGQGVLFDPRRPEGQRVHLMDYTNGVDPPGGYHVWHAINRALMLLDVDARWWRAFDPLVGLGWAVQSIAKPAVDEPHNPRLSRFELAALRRRWLPMRPAQLDTEFDSIPYPAVIH